MERQKRGGGSLPDQILTSFDHDRFVGEATSQSVVLVTVPGPGSPNSGRLVYIYGDYCFRPEVQLGSMATRSGKSNLGDDMGIFFRVLNALWWKKKKHLLPFKRRFF